MKTLTMKIDTKQAVKNEMYKTLDTKESKKLIKPEKKVNIESIFIKNKSPTQENKKKIKKIKTKSKK